MSSSKTIPIKSLSGHFRWVRKNRLGQSRGGMSYILGVTEEQITLFETGQDTLPPGVIREIFSAGLFMLYLRCHLVVTADPDHLK